MRTTSPTAKERSPPSGSRDTRAVWRLARLIPHLCAVCSQCSIETQRTPPRAGRSARPRRPQLPLTALHRQPPRPPVHRAREALARRLHRQPGACDIRPLCPLDPSAPCEILRASRAFPPRPGRSLGQPYQTAHVDHSARARAVPRLSPPLRAILRLALLARLGMSAPTLCGAAFPRASSPVSRPAAAAAAAAPPLAPSPTGRALAHMPFSLL